MSKKSDSVYHTWVLQELYTLQTTRLGRNTSATPSDATEQIDLDLSDYFFLGTLQSIELGYP